MTYIRRFLTTILLLMIPVPWFAENWLTETWYGLPLWFIYSVAMTAVFTLLVAALLERYWTES